MTGTSAPAPSSRLNPDLQSQGFEPAPHGAVEGTSTTSLKRSPSPSSPDEIPMKKPQLDPEQTKLHLANLCIYWFGTKYPQLGPEKFYQHIENEWRKEMGYEPPAVQELMEEWLQELDKRSCG
jgi:hypothetical protein